MSLKVLTESYRRSGLARHRYIRRVVLLAPSNDVLRLVAVLLGHNADVNKEDFYDRATPLGWAARKGWHESADRILKAGANVDAGFPGGKTPLIEAAQGGHVLTVKVLLNHGADFGAKDERGITALAWLYRCPSPRKEEVIALLTQVEREAH